MFKLRDYGARLNVTLNCPFTCKRFAALATCWFQIKMATIHDSQSISAFSGDGKSVKPAEDSEQVSVSHDKRSPFQSLHAAIKKLLPRRLFARSLIIIVAPVVLTQGIVTYIFFERHWDTVTRRLSEGVAGDIAMIIETYEAFSEIRNIEQLSEMSLRTTSLDIAVMEDTKLPSRFSPSFFSILDRTLSRELNKKLKDRPFWFDTTEYPHWVDIRVQLGEDVLRVLVQKQKIFAASGLIFVVWMIGTSLVILTVAIIFLRNQVRPIQQLASAASRLGKGRDVDDFKPHGATEVRRAAEAFLEMRDRIKLQIEQRTLLLAGVSHDLKTPITRMKLQTAMMAETEELDALKRDLIDMEHMLEEYLAFARGQGSETPSPTDIEMLLLDIVEQTQRSGREIGLHCDGDLTVSVRRNAIKRCISNLVDNAIQHGNRIYVSAQRHNGQVQIMVDDDGPGIPDDKVEDAFKPFSRLDESRNLDTTGVGLGLAIAQDIARGHGGEIELLQSPWEGLRARLTLPV